MTILQQNAGHVFNMECIPVVTRRSWGHQKSNLRWFSDIPSGKHTKKSGKSPLLMGKLTISTANFNSKLLVYQRVNPMNIPLNHYKSRLNYQWHIEWPSVNDQLSKVKGLAFAARSVCVFSLLCRFGRRFGMEQCGRFGMEQLVKSSGKFGYFGWNIV